MRLYPEQLAAHLKAGLKPCYLVFGDEPLQKLEALDAIRATALQQGFSERYRYATDDNPDWEQVLASCHALSLFATRQILELELGDKPPKEWAERVQAIQAALHPDLLLLISGPRLSAAQSKAKWFDTLSRLGVYLTITFPEGRHFTRWMQGRCQQANVHLQPEAIQFLCHAFEGNLLGAAQAIEKLALLQLPQPIGLSALQENITQHNHFTPFQLLDTLLEGKANRAQRILLQLRGEGVEAGLLCWSLARELEQLLRLRLAMEEGQAIGPLLEQARIWSSRQPLYQSALQRLNSRQLRQLITLTTRLDSSVRCFEQEEPWLLLQSLCIGFKNPAGLEFLLI